MISTLSIIPPTHYSDGAWFADQSPDVTRLAHQSTTNLDRHPGPHHPIPQSPRCSWDLVSRQDRPTADLDFPVSPVLAPWVGVRMEEPVEVLDSLVVVLDLEVVSGVL